MTLKLKITVSFDEGSLEEKEGFSKTGFLLGALSLSFSGLFAHRINIEFCTIFPNENLFSLLFFNLFYLQAFHGVNIILLHFLLIHIGLIPKPLKATIDPSFNSK